MFALRRGVAATAAVGARPLIVWRRPHVERVLSLAFTIGGRAGRPILPLAAAHQRLSPRVRCFCAKGHRRHHANGSAAHEPGRGTEKWIVRKEFTRERKVAKLGENSEVLALAREMKTWMEEYHSPDPFFHRKSNRVILAVMHVHIDGESHYVRGVNSEASLPTGSICAERTCIVHARSRFPSITREHMKGIAVLEVAFQSDDSTGSDETQGALLNNPLPPCGACREWLEKIQKVNKDFYVLTFPDLSFDMVHERLLFWSQDEVTEQPKELGPWKCRKCDFSNVPLSSTCQNCSVSRFGPQYNRAPNQKVYMAVLQLLSDRSRTEQGLAAILSNHSPNFPVDKLPRFLKRLTKLWDGHGGEGSEYGGLVEKVGEKYAITRRGREALQAHQKKNLVKAKSAH